MYHNTTKKPTDTDKHFVGFKKLKIRWTCQTKHVRIFGKNIGVQLPFPGNKKYLFPLL